MNHEKLFQKALTFIMEAENQGHSIEEVNEAVRRAVANVYGCPFHGKDCTSEPPWDGISCGRTP